VQEICGQSLLADIRRAVLEVSVEDGWSGAHNPKLYTLRIGRDLKHVKFPRGSHGQRAGAPMAGRQPATAVWRKHDPRQ
jgi:hypothetical protein